MTENTTIASHIIADGKGLSVQQISIWLKVVDTNTADKDSVHYDATKTCVNTFCQLMINQNQNLSEILNNNISMTQSWRLWL